MAWITISQLAVAEALRFDKRNCSILERVSRRRRLLTAELHIVGKVGVLACGIPRWTSWPVLVSALSVVVVLVKAVSMVVTFVVAMVTTCLLILMALSGMI